MSEADSKRAFYRQGSWLVIATFISGLLMFAVHIFGGWMSRGEYGLFVTLLQILNLMMIPALGLQTVFAQQTAAAIEPQQQHDLSQVHPQNAPHLPIYLDGDCGDCSPESRGHS